jgi:hypothetical protein
VKNEAPHFLTYPQ